MKPGPVRVALVLVLALCLASTSQVEASAGQGHTTQQSLQPSRRLLLQRLARFAAESEVDGDSSQGDNSTDNDADNSTQAGNVTGSNTTTTVLDDFNATADNVSATDTDTAAPPPLSVPPFEALKYNTSEELKNHSEHPDDGGASWLLPVHTSVNSEPNTTNSSNTTVIGGNTTTGPGRVVTVQHTTEAPLDPGQHVLSVAQALNDIQYEPFMGNVNKDVDYTRIIAGKHHLQVPAIYEVRNPHSWTSQQNATRPLGLPKQSDASYTYDVHVNVPEGLSVMATAQYQLDKLVIKRNRLMDDVESIEERQKQRAARLKNTFTAVDRMYREYLAEVAAEQPAPGDKPDNLQFIAHEMVAAQAREYAATGRFLAHSPVASDRRARLRINALRLEVAAARALQTSVAAVARQCGIETHKKQPSNAPPAAHKAPPPAAAKSDAADSTGDGDDADDDTATQKSQEEDDDASKAKAKAKDLESSESSSAVSNKDAAAEQDEMDT